MQCVLCGGDTSPRLIQTEWPHHGRSFKLNDVPADVCVACDEPYFELATVDFMREEAAQLWATCPETAS